MALIDLSKISYSSSSITGAGVFYYKGGKLFLTTLPGDGADTIIGGNGQDYIEAGGGNDTISGGNGKDTIYGGAGNDTISGDRKNALDTIEDNAKDIIYGGSGRDTIYGGNGADVLYGDGKNTGTGATITGSDSETDAISAQPLTELSESKAYTILAPA